MVKEWFYTRDASNKTGPFSGLELKQLADRGEIRPDDLIWKEGMPKPVAARQVKGLFSLDRTPSALRKDETTQRPAGANPASPTPDRGVDLSAHGPGNGVGDTPQGHRDSRPYRPASAPTFRCSRCAFERQVSEDLVGKKARCPKCKEVSLIANDPLALDVIEIQDDEPDALRSELPRDHKAVDYALEGQISEALPPQTQQKLTEKGGPGIPRPRSYLTTALLAGGYFIFGMGLFAAFQKGIDAGIMAVLITGPLFGFAVAFLVSGRQVVVRFKSREDFINDMKLAFKKIKHELCELSGPIFTFKPEQGGFLCTSYVHVGQREALFVGPRTVVKKCVEQLSDRHEVDWTGESVKEDHGEAPPDAIAQYAWTAAIAVLLFVL